MTICPLSPTFVCGSGRETFMPQTSLGPNWEDREVSPNQPRDVNSETATQLDMPTMPLRLSDHMSKQSHLSIFELRQGKL